MNCCFSKFYLLATSKGRTFSGIILPMKVLRKFVRTEIFTCNFYLILKGCLDFEMVQSRFFHKQQQGRNTSKSQFLGRSYIGSKIAGGDSNLVVSWRLRNNYFTESAASASQLDPILLHKSWLWSSKAKRKNPVDLIAENGKALIPLKVTWQASSREYVFFRRMEGIWLSLTVRN